MLVPVIRAIVSRSVRPWMPIVARLTEVVDVNEQKNSVIGKQLKFSC